MPQQQNRPVFLNLFQIKLPPTAIISILHRLAGVLLILFLPFLIYLFDMSLQDKTSFTQVTSLVDHPLVCIILYFLLWAISHHFVAGIRYFLIDFEVISSKSVARTSAIIVFIAGLSVPVLVWLGNQI